MLKKKDPPMLCVVFLTDFGLKVFKKKRPFHFQFFFSFRKLKIENIGLGIMLVLCLTWQKILVFLL